MKPKLLKIALAPEHSFSIRYDVVPFFFNEWHFHPEIELVYINDGTGTQFIGDNIQQFNTGDMVLVGSNLPHLWLCDEKYFVKANKLKVTSTVIHFMPDMLGNSFFKLPENKEIDKLLEKARMGLHIYRQTNALILEKMQALLLAQSSEKIILLLQILHILAHSKELSPIVSKNYQLLIPQKESERINIIYQHVFNQFKHPVKLEEVAALIHMSPNSFCRYFKTRTRKTFSSFLLEVRINHACKLLTETDLTISEICYKCGFNNFSNFNRHFKKETGYTPLQYKTKYR